MNKSLEIAPDLVSLVVQDLIASLYKNSDLTPEFIASLEALLGKNTFSQIELEMLVRSEKNPHD